MKNKKNKRKLEMNTKGNEKLKVLEGFFFLFFLYYINLIYKTEYKYIEYMRHVRKTVLTINKI